MQQIRGVIICLPSISRNETVEPEFQNKPISSFTSGESSSFNQNIISWELHLNRNLRELEISDFCSILDILSNIRLNDDKRILEFGNQVAGRGFLENHYFPP